MPSLKTVIHSPATLWFFTIATIAGILVGWLALPWKEWLTWFNHWIAGFGAWAIVIFALAYILAVIALVPTTPLTIAAGLAFGAWAFPLVLLVSTLGAAIAFVAARHFARDRVLEWVKRRPKLRVIDQVVANNSWKIVALIRLSPFLTFGLQNYLFGLSGVRSLPYVTASLVGIIPSTALCIYVGAAGHLMQGRARGGSLEWAMVIAGFVVLLALTIYTAHQAREKLLEAGIGRV
jgi:uncharacterized membrane protein YdjX (TVP38/TMEM64 family)